MGKFWQIGTELQPLIDIRNWLPSTKNEGLSYPTHFLKSRGSGIRNNFLEYRTKQVNIFCETKCF